MKNTILATVLMVTLGTAFADHNGSNNCGVGSHGACTNGIDGLDGTNGVNGTNGVDGAAGATGEAGINGRDVDPQTVRNLQRGMALSFATANQQYDWSYSGLQGSIGVANVSDSSAISFGIGQRISDRAFTNITYARSGAVTGVAAAIGFKF